ncbi:MAG: DUF885 domain-containing protein, partial [Pseudomonadota bacterium]
PENSFRSSAQSVPLDTQEDRDNYADALRRYAVYLGGQTDKLREQADRGIRVPKPALPSARAVVRNLTDASVAFVPNRARMPALDDVQAEDFRRTVSALVESDIKPAFQHMGSVLDADYEALAPMRVGLMHQPGGLDIYRELVALYTGTDLSPEQIHETGQSILRDARAELEGIWTELGFEGTKEEFAQKVDADPRFRAETSEDIERFFLDAMERIEPSLADYFDLLPEAPYTVERAPRAVEEGMTFGYYRPPSERNPVGAYVYNGSDPSDRSYANAAALIYHELLPGHHFQIALALEDETLPLLQRGNAFVPTTAYVEGWAEYAADLAGEMGLYQTPYERYGRLYSKMFLANRLMTDTGLNALGWTLDEARTFMRENTFASDAEIESELLRYSTDIPGQALAYAMGQRELLRMRSKARSALGEDFNFPDFHREVLRHGALPIGLLEDQLDLWIETTR